MLIAAAHLQNFLLAFFSSSQDAIFHFEMATVCEKSPSSILSACQWGKSKTLLGTKSGLFMVRDGKGPFWRSHSFTFFSRCLLAKSCLRSCALTVTKLIGGTRFRSIAVFKEQGIFAALCGKHNWIRYAFFSDFSNGRSVLCRLT
jgi:hypothetical protein